MIEKNAQVNLAAIVQSNDKFGDEIACLCVQLHEHNPDSEKQFQAWLTAKMDPDYRPREVRFITQMKLTPNSKVDKKHLVAQLSEKS
jgi:non-ribosomal peptide synthetase component E (peptide arylation enzyme)